MASLTTFQENMIKIHGIKGQQWLDSLDAKLNAICKKYGILSLSPVNNMTFNYVASGIINNKPVIVKYGFNKESLAKEAAAIKAFSNHSGIVHIANEPHLIIMKQALPGHTIKELFPTHDESATKILCRLLKKLHQAAIPQNNDFYRLSSLFQVIDDCNELPSGILSKARQLKVELLKKSNKPVLLHGDLHHDNIIKANNSYVVIDPKGFIGDPLYDLTAFIINPMPNLLQNNQASKIIQNRIELCANAFGVSTQDISNWTFLKAVKCWIWCLQDNLEDGYFKKVTSILETLYEI